MFSDQLISLRYDIFARDEGDTRFVPYLAAVSCIPNMACTAGAGLGSGVMGKLGHIPSVVFGLRVHEEIKIPDECESLLSDGSAGG